MVAVLDSEDIIYLLQQIKTSPERANIMETTNDLRFTTGKTVGKESITVKIRLNDECKNGHQDFSITGEVYETGKPRTDRFLITAGCIHDTIEKHFPEFIPFIRLHLCDYKGIPMHASANGFYHLQNGFSKNPKDSDNFKSEYCDYYRVTPEQFDKLEDSFSELHFASLIIDLGILEQWDNEAKKAIEQLEQLTGKKFVIDSKRTQWHPTDEQIKKERELIASGHYSAKKIAERKQAKIDQKIKDMEQDASKKIAEIKQDLDLDIQLYKMGGSRFQHGVIWYKHTNTLKINWSNNDLSDKEIKTIKANLVTPKGATYAN